jgi:cellulose synthase/poly-beta-1,6-N-acetylglucosamine synthase-like glycosyltransferase
MKTQNNKCRLSVIIPCYNEEKTLEKMRFQGSVHQQ